MTDQSVRAEVPRGWRPFRSGFDVWSGGAILIALAVALPILSVVFLALFPRENIWPHLLSTVLPRYVGNSLILMLSTGIGTAIIGTGCAWLVAMTRFPGRWVLERALLFPMALPAYIAAYALVDFLEYAGPVQTLLRDVFGWTSARDYWFPQIRSMWAAIAVMVLSLYPYVYLLARSAFREQSATMLEVARALGCGPWAMFFRVALPLARPAIAAGVAIAMMETLNDFGAVDYFAVQTLTTGVFSTWLEGYNVGGAAQISVVMLMMVLGLVLLERQGRKGQRFHNMGKRHFTAPPTRLSGWSAWAASFACVIPVLLGFVLPLLVISWRGFAHLSDWADADLWWAAFNTAWLAVAAASICIIAALFMVYGARQSRLKLPRILMPLTAIGYAAPGAVLAIGVLIPTSTLDTFFADTVLLLTGFDPGLLLTGSAMAVIMAYCVRFFAISQGGIDAALGRVTPSMDMAARSLGRGMFATLREVHVPLIRASLITVGLLTFVDSAKELPATLILRPFNFDTLATKVYGHASLENLGEAAPAALIVIAIGMLPVIFLNRLGTRRQ